MTGRWAVGRRVPSRGVPWLLWAGLALFKPTAAQGHLGTPFGDVLGPILDADVVVLVRAAAETETGPTGARTSVDLVAPLVGRAPRHFMLEQPPPHFHRHRAGAVFVAPARRMTDTRFRVLSETATPLDARPADAGALRRVIAEWRRLPQPTPPGLRLRHSLARLQEDTAVGRRLVLEQLLAAAAGTVAGETMATADDQALVAAIANHRLPEAYRLGLVRFASLAGRRECLLRLCTLDAALPPLLRGAVYEAQLVPPTACVRAAIESCAARPSDPLTARCRTLAARIQQ